VRHHAERQWQWLGGIAILAGGLTLGGIPPLVGFAARWSIYHDLAASSLPLVVVLLASNATAVLATLRVAVPLFMVRAEVAGTKEVKILPYLCAALVVALLFVALATGFFPQVVVDPLVATVGNASFLK